MIHLLRGTSATARPGGCWRPPLATPAHCAQGNDATFGKFISLYEGDKYVDPLKTRLQSEQQSRSKNVVDRPFKTAGHLPKHATPGDFYGTSGKVPYMPVSAI